MRYYIRLKYNDDEYNIKCFRYLESLGFRNCGATIETYLKSAIGYFVAGRTAVPVFVTDGKEIYTTYKSFDEIEKEYTEIKFKDSLSMDIE